MPKRTPPHPTRPFGKLNRLDQRQQLDDALEEVRRSLPRLLDSDIDSLTLKIESLISKAMLHDPGEAKTLKTKWDALQTALAEEGTPNVP